MVSLWQVYRSIGRWPVCFGVSISEMLVELSGITLGDALAPGRPGGRRWSGPLSEVLTPWDHVTVGFRLPRVAPGERLRPISGTRYPFVNVDVRALVDQFDHRMAEILHLLAAAPSPAIDEADEHVFLRLRWLPV